MKRYFHYTTRNYLDSILDDGKIIPATEYVPKNEKPICWISTNENWEMTALKGIVNELGQRRRLTFEEQAERGDCCRIEIKSFKNLFTYSKLKHVANMDLIQCRALEDVAIAGGANPKEWYGCLKAIPDRFFIRAEIYEDGKWELYEEYD